jgi:hypothetical protein
LSKGSGYVLALLASTVLIINLGFAFEKTLVPFGEYKFRSRAFDEVQSSWSALKPLPVPLPYAYLGVLDYGKDKQETGKGSGTPYLMGRLATPNSRFAQYYLVALLYKLPIATQCLILIALCRMLYQRSLRAFLDNEIFLLLPPVMFLVVLSTSNAQLGIRYVLMIFPFLFVLAGGVAAKWPALGYRQRFLVFGLALYLLISNLSYYPHYLSYFNELIADRKMAYRVLADSNLDWGQNKYYLQGYLQKHPDAAYVGCSGDGQFQVVSEKMPADRRRPIRIVVEANSLVGVKRPDAAFFKWLRENKEPVSHVAYSYLVFELSPKDQPDLLNPQNSDLMSLDSCPHRSHR